MATNLTDLQTIVRAAIDPLHEDEVAYTPEGVAIAALAAIPDGWSKRNGEWVETCDIELDAEGVVQVSTVKPLRREYEKLRATLEEIANCDCHAAETARKALDG